MYNLYSFIVSPQYKFTYPLSKCFYVSLPFYQSCVNKLMYSAVKRSMLGACSSTGLVSYLDANTATVHKLDGCHAAPCSSLAFSPINEILLVSVGYDKKMICHNVKTNK